MKASLEPRWWEKRSVDADWRRFIDPLIAFGLKPDWLQLYVRLLYPEWRS